MQPQLTIIALSLWLIVSLGLTCVVYSLISMWKENRFGWPLRGIIWFTLAIAASCAIIALLAGYVQKTEVIGESHTPRKSCDGEMNMQVTEVRIRRTKKASVKAHAIICFDNCFLVRELKVIKGPAGLFVSLPAKQLSDGTHWDIVFPLYAETRTMIEQAVLAEYEKVVGKSDPVRSEKK